MGQWHEEIFIYALIGKQQDMQNKIDRTREAK
jgi:hypothetical protein